MHDAWDAYACMSLRLAFKIASQPASDRELKCIVYSSPDRCSCTHMQPIMYIDSTPIFNIPRSINFDTTNKVMIIYCSGYPAVDVRCARLYDPRYGRVFMTGTTLGSVATYHCNRGYRTFGTSRRTCQSNRFWSGQAPVCTREA